MKKQTLLKNALPAISASLVMASSASAAVITWGSTQAVVGATDVSTTGNLVEAFNLGYTNAGGGNAFGLTDETVNGVTFTAAIGPAPFTSTGGDPYNQLAGGDTGDASYNDLLNSVAFGGGGNLFSITVGDGGINATSGSGLQTGTQYEIQLWFVDERVGTATRTMQFGDGNGNTVNVGNAVTSTLGEYAIGTFTADGATQTLTLDALGFGNAHFTAYQLRAVPEPSSTALLGLAGLALILRRRR